MVGSADRLPDEVREVQRDVFWADVDALAGEPPGTKIQRPYRPGEFFEYCDDQPESGMFGDTSDVQVWFIDMFGDPSRGYIRMREPLPGPDMVFTDAEDAANWIVQEGRQ